MPEDSYGISDNARVHLISRTAGWLAGAPPKVDETSQSSYDVRAVQPGEDKEERRMRVAVEERAAVKDLEPDN